MEWISNTLTPVSVLFFAVIAGMLIGKIKFGLITFGVSAVLIVSIFTGWFLSGYFPLIFNSEFKTAMTQFSKLGTVLFISSIGITSGYCINKNNIKEQLAFLIPGILMTAVGFITVFAIEAADKNIDKPLLLGILCGALTSTPGLSAVNEIEFLTPGLAAIGYGTSYLFGVIGTVLYVQIFAAKIPESKDLQDNVKALNNTEKESLFIISVVAVIGTLLGNVKFPFVNYSLGTTGGVLIIGITVGIITAKSEKTFRDFSLYRNLGLILFFVGNGISAGKNLNLTFDARWFVYGAIITISTLFAGSLFGMIFIKKDILHRVYILAGGMTSTPALGAITNKTNNITDISVYSIVYLGALFSMVLGIRIINL